MVIIREVEKVNEHKLAIVIDMQTMNESKLVITTKYKLTQQTRL